ncbi:CLUMA_CG003551, isoform A [Clunio marinus]|uniref:CLUMA_CG003551, isoform A n=1 Tax=Clunio marinus TaxID=568069 RepID=A0A1J1HQR0_9DIPT|nr:CLUMA_CG003551, isoform A [Clunio marinus]
MKLRKVLKLNSNFTITLNNIKSPICNLSQLLQLVIDEFRSHFCYFNKSCNDSQCQKFAVRNPKVDTMNIKKIGKYFDIVKFLKNMKLQHFDLPVTKVDANVCKALRENTQDMKSLRIHKASFENFQEKFSDVKCFQTS